MIALTHVHYYDFKTYAKDQYIIFDEKIVEVGPMTDFVNQDYEIIEGKGRLVMPGLINGHHHIYSTFARGLMLPFDPDNFQEILDQLWWKLDGSQDLDNVYYSGIVSGVEGVKNGITTIIDHHASGLDIRGSLETLKKAVCDEVGLRGIFCFESSDRFDIDACIEENLSFAKHHQTTKVAGLFGLHAAMSLSEESLTKISKVIGDLPIHIHVAESHMDEDLSLERYGERIIHRLDRHQLLNKNSLLVHCLYVDEAEADLIGKRKCTVALNVTSNMNNGVGLPDHDLLSKAGIPVIIGNDGIASGIAPEWLNLNFAMHHKDLTPVRFGLGQVLEMVNQTYVYASSILGCKMGRIWPGYEADLLMIPYVPPTPMNMENAFGHVCFGLANSFNPSNVWCGGKKILDDYKVEDKLMKTYQEASKSARQLWDRIQ